MRFFVLFFYQHLRSKMRTSYSLPPPPLLFSHIYIVKKKSRNRAKRGCQVSYGWIFTESKKLIFLNDVCLSTVEYSAIQSVKLFHLNLECVIFMAISREFSPHFFWLLKIWDSCHRKSNTLSKLVLTIQLKDPNKA